MKKRPIYIFGHKNPDTDAIVSAVAYAQYKKAQGINAVAGRIGSVAPETEYLLERFKFDDPVMLFTAKSILKEIDMDKAALADKKMTMKEALDKVIRLKNRGLIVVDKKKKLEGIVTLDDLTYMWTKTDEQLESIIRTIEVDNIVKTLEGKLVLRVDRPLSGKMHMFPSLKSNVEDDSIVLLRNEDDKMQYCLELGASLLVICTSSPISERIMKLAKDAGASIVTTELTPLYITRLIYQTPTIENIMIKKAKIDYFSINDTVDEASKKIAKSRHRSYPVLDDEGRVVGAISRYHLFNYQKKQLILVDHNEKKQSIDDIDEGIVLEIVDHHRFDGFRSDNPINITTMPIGATATIVANMYLNNSSVKLNKNMAGLLLGAILSDTMNFKSPTTTSVDVEAAAKLVKISGVDPDELFKSIIEHADSLLGKRLIEIVYNDFKEFTIDGNRVGLAQAVCKSRDEYYKIRDDLQKYLDDSCKSGGYDLMAIMLTLANGSGSYILSSGEKKKVVRDGFKRNEEGFVSGLVSRKKQLLPGIISTMGAK
ncbi:MAG: putative manganese-dependent inorganic diphosphatase [Erysipelotrichaceae bacterium]|nr:putative manganese-dependent inorganic diphosphatase [Erysipelotrichaceae bacterium]